MEYQYKVWPVGQSWNWKARVAAGTYAGEQSLGGGRRCVSKGTAEAAALAAIQQDQAEQAAKWVTA